MNARADFVSRSTGRVLLSALFDTPPDGLSRRECQRIITVLKNTKEKLEGICGTDTVRLSIDDYASSMFWYLVFLRPVVFDANDPWFKGDPWSIYEIIEDDTRSHKLKEMNLGVVYDADRNWLTLIWDEAIKGVLDDMEMCPSWKQVLKEQEKRTGQSVNTDWWKTCARSHSFALPTWRVAKHGYLRGVLWHRPKLSYDDIVVFDLNGIDLPFINDMGKVELPTAKKARFVHFYTDDKREFQALQKNLQPRKWKELHRSRSAARSYQRREARKEKNAEWIRASNAIYDIIKIVGGGYYGRRAMFLVGTEVRAKFNDLVRRFNAGELRILQHDVVSWGNINYALATLEECLRDERVPREFELWLQWRDNGALIDELNIPDTER